MNYIRHLAGFFSQVANDDRLNPTHISMYVSLFQFWNASRFQNPISISRSELMKVSKISAKATYHKCMKDLHNYGYLNYKPSYNPFKGSLVYLFNLEATPERPLYPHHIKNETAPEQVQEPYINSSKQNKQNSLNNHTQAPKEKNKKSGNNSLPPVAENQNSVEKKEKLRKKKEFVPPEIGHVEEYFIQQSFTLIEAQKFHNYFQSNGWLVGGKTPMKDWKPPPATGCSMQKNTPIQKTSLLGKVWAQLQKTSIQQPPKTTTNPCNENEQHQSAACLRSFAESWG